MDYLLLNYIFYTFNLKIPYRVTPLSKYEALFLKKTLEFSGIDIDSITQSNIADPETEAGLIKTMVSFLKQRRQIIQISVNDPYYETVVQQMINEAYFVPICLNYETVIEDALHRRTGLGEDISMRIEQLSTLRLYDPDHKRAKVMLNFSNPISDNYRSLMVDRIFI